MTDSRADVAERFLDIAYQMTAAAGPAALSLRAVQRAAGVSAATAYWYYKDRAELQLAVSRRATADLANALDDAVRDRIEGIESDLAAICLAYLHFARDHPGLFRAVVQNSSIQELLQPAAAARGRSGLAAFEILQRAVTSALGDVTGAPPVDDVSIHAWAASHGLAVILLESPLADLPEPEQERLRRQHVDLVLRSIVVHAEPNDPRGEFL